MLQVTLAAVVLFAILWLAYKIGKILLRVLLGLLLLGLAGYAGWWFFLRHP